MTDQLSAARTQYGKNADEINAYLNANGQTIDATNYNWSTAFVNASLQAAGIQGSSSATATSFADWGLFVDWQPLSGDVVIVGAGDSASLVNRVGLATGLNRYNPVTGSDQYQVIMGNVVGRVTYCWQNPWGVTIRRAVNAGDVVPLSTTIPTDEPAILIDGTISNLAPYGDSMVQAQLLSGIALGETGGNTNLNLGPDGSDLTTNPKDEFGFPIWSGTYTPPVIDIIQLDPLISDNSRYLGFPSFVKDAAGPYRWQRGSFATLAKRLDLYFQNAADQNAAVWYDAQDTYNRWAATSNPVNPTLTQALNLGAFDDIQTALMSRWSSVTGNDHAIAGLADYLQSGLINRPLFFGRADA